MANNNLTLEQKLLTKIREEDGCWVWTGYKCKRGYGKIRINGIWKRAHRIMHELRKGPLLEGQVVLHSCDNPSCINPDHLSAGTQKDNVHDMLKKGRANRNKGERHHSSKLTDDEVREIRRRYSPGEHGKGAHVLAREFGVSKPVILDIIHRKTWCHIA